MRDSSARTPDSARIVSMPEPFKKVPIAPKNASYT